MNDKYTKEEIMYRVNTSFSSVPYPHGHDFYKAIADRDYEEYVENVRIKEWNEISEEELLRYYDFIFFLKPEGVVYYLPTYFHLILENNKIASHWCAESVLMAIADLDIRILSNEQQNSIYQFLNFCWTNIHPVEEMDDELIRKALDKLEGIDGIRLD